MGDVGLVWMDWSSRSGNAYWVLSQLPLCSPRLACAPSNGSVTMSCWRVGTQRYTNAAGLRYLPRPRTSGINDFAGPDVHGECVGFRQQGRAAGRRCSGIADGNLCRIEIRVITDPHRRYDTRRLQERVEAAGLLRRDEFDIKAHATPTFEIRLDNFRVSRPTRDLQAARNAPSQGVGQSLP